MSPITGILPSVGLPAAQDSGLLSMAAGSRQLSQDAQQLRTPTIKTSSTRCSMQANRFCCSKPAPRSLKPQTGCSAACSTFSPERPIRPAKIRVGGKSAGQSVRHRRSGRGTLLPNIADGISARIRAAGGIPPHCKGHYQGRNAETRQVHHHGRQHGSTVEPAQSQINALVRHVAHLKIPRLES